MNAKQDTPDMENTDTPLETSDNVEAIKTSDLNEQLAEAREQHLRAVAELDNVRKRGQKELSAALKYGAERLAAALLEVKDNLERGLDAAKQAPSIESLQQGSEMTLQQLADVMSQFGVSEIDPQGETFDPEFHEALTTVPTAEHAPNTVMEVVQKGYMLHDRLLRAARVVVSAAAETSD